MNKQNCWEFFRCGREPEGANVRGKGGCRAAADTEANGLNGGKNGGRICWAIVGTHSECDIHTQKYSLCMDCDFYKKVKAEENFLEYYIVKPETKT